MTARDAYSGMGAWIGSHMPLMSLVCLALGVALPELISPLKALVSVMFAVITFQGALGNTLSQLAEAFRRPVAMLSILLVSAVLMPCAGCVVGNLLFGSDPEIVCGIVLEYSVPVAVLSVMWTGIYEGNGALAVATVLVSTLLSPLTIPLGMKLLLGRTVEVPVAGMMLGMLVRIALPAFLGSLVNDRTHGWGKGVLSPALAPACRLMMLVVIAANSTAVSAYMRHLTPELVGVILCIATLAASGYALGLVVARLLRRDRADAVTICFGCGMRNISSGAVIAGQYFADQVMFPVLMGTLFQQVLAALFGKVVDRMMGGAR